MKTLSKKVVAGPRNVAVAAGFIAQGQLLWSLGGWCFSRVANPDDVSTLGQ